MYSKYNRLNQFLMLVLGLEDMVSSQVLLKTKIKTKTFMSGLETEIFVDWSRELKPCTRGHNTGVRVVRSAYLHCISMDKFVLTAYQTGSIALNIAPLCNFKKLLCF